MLGRVKGHIWSALGEAVTEHRLDSDRFMDMLAGVQQLRVWAEELQSACLHLVALPTRQDVRQVHRRVTALRQRVAELDALVSSIERHGEQRVGPQPGPKR